MSKYEFNIRKISEKKVEVKAQNKKEAFEKIIEFLAIGEQVLFKNSNGNNDMYEIKMQKLTTEQLSKNKKEMQKIVDKIIEELEKDLQEYEENSEETIDDLPKIYDEIVCDNCGNCITLE